jgi:hypothetical protein
MIYVIRGKNLKIVIHKPSLKEILMIGERCDKQIYGIRKKQENYIV